MVEVVAVGLPEEVVAPLAGASTRVRRTTAAELADTFDPRATAAVVAPAEAGVPLARLVHDHDPQVAVVFVAPDQAERDRLHGELAITPGIGRHTTCVVAGTTDGDATLRDEVDRARLRFEHRATMAELRTTVRAFEGTAPETLSVYLGQLFEHAPIGILLVDPAGTVRAANPCSGEVLGWQPRHAVGTSLPSMFPAGETDVAARLVEGCMTTGEPREATLTRTGPDGSVQHLDVTVAPVDPEHWNLGAFVLLRDESARIQALEATERARRQAQADAERYAELAWTLQESLLPPALPEIPGVEVASRFHPAGDGSEVGGDFFDIFQVSEDEWFAVIGDICGKGAAAARLTALTRYTLRAATVRTRTIERNLSDLNAALSRQYELDHPRGEHRFATATALRFSSTEGGRVVLEAGSGGHPPPLVIRADGELEELACRGPLLGVFPTGAFVSARTELAPGDVVVLYTDGVTEARRGREEFGEHRLHELLAATAGRGADAIAGAVEDSVLAFQSGNARDDIAVLALGAPAPTAS
jgi:phosphoserine phosphatase RsbU/P